MTTFLKSLGAALYARVFVFYRSTLVGIGLSAAVEAMNFSAVYLGAKPQPWAHALAAVLVIVGGMLKGKAKPVPAP